jgi:hypothetical protein
MGAPDKGARGRKEETKKKIKQLLDGYIRKKESEIHWRECLIFASLYPIINLTTTEIYISI